MPDSDLELLTRLAVALAIGLLLGLERGSVDRAEAEVARRITGMRTFALVSVLGAVSALLADQLGAAVLGLAFLGLALLVTAAHVLSAREGHDYGITTVIALLLSFALGAATMQGHVGVTAAIGVIAVTLLGMKPLLHTIETRMQRMELEATVKLLLLSVVILPVLPNQGYGPWQALNPYVIWWMVVLIAGISWVGYFGIKLAGPRRGLTITGLLGGLASSTALTLQFSRLCRERPEWQSLIAGGILIACGTMYPRMLLLAAVIDRELARSMAVPLLSMAAVLFIAAAWSLRGNHGEMAGQQTSTRNPFELGMALKLGALLAVIMFLAQALKEWLGESGLFLLAAISGIGDVDAINLALARMTADGELAASLAAMAIILAAVINTLFKGSMAISLSQRLLLRSVGIPMGLSIVVGTVLVLIGSY